MKRLFLTLFLIVPLLWSCQSSDEYDALPRSISTFVSQYWPNPDIESYTHPGPDVYVVVIHNGPRLTFDAAYAWTEIDGLGLPLPDNLLFNELPDPLYRYLTETEATDAVFGMARNPRAYTLQLLESSLTYDIATQAVSVR